jgi:predicted NBD/HSP70 family sugar kinase
VGALAQTRELNRLRLLNELREAAPADRAELGRRTGLSRATVSALVADFLASGAVTEMPDPAGSGAPGRTPGLLRLDPRAAAVLGVDFGHRHIHVAVVDLAGEVLAERRLDLDVHAGASAALDVAASLVDVLLPEAGVDPGRVIGVGMGLPAPIAARDGLVQNPSLLAAWEAVRPAEELAARLSLPVRVANDADLGALAEGTFGAGRDFENLLYVKLSTGVGAALILDGELHIGATGIAGEIGHLGVDRLGVICRCGNRGCLETIASGDAIRRALQPAHGSGLTMRRIVALADADDPAAVAAISHAGTAVGDALAPLCTGLDVDAIIIGGDLGARCAPLRAAIAARVRERALPPTGDIPILAAELGDRAEPLGAATLALTQTGWLRASGVIALVDRLPWVPVD